MLETFLTVLFIFLLLYYAFRLLFRYGLPWLLSRHMRKHQQKYYDIFGWQKPGDFSKEEEGNVKVKNVSKKGKKKEDKDFGEYVDFEDVNE